MSELEPIEQSRNRTILERADLKEIVEKPLLSACEKLYDKNIRTLSTSCNKKDIETGFAYIIIDFDTLSTENQEIARQMGDPISYDEMMAVKIELPISVNTTATEVERSANDIADRFHDQPATWIKGYTLEEVHQIYGSTDTETKPEDLAAETGMAYNPDQKLFYPSEEHLNKARSISISRET